MFFTHHRMVFYCKFMRFNVIILCPGAENTIPILKVQVLCRIQPFWPSQRQGDDSLLKHHKLKIISLITNFSTDPLPRSLIQARGCVSQINQCRATTFRESAIFTCPIRPDVSDVSVLIIETTKYWSARCCGLVIIFTGASGQGWATMSWDLHFKPENIVSCSNHAVLIGRFVTCGSTLQSANAALLML